MANNNNQSLKISYSDEIADYQLQIAFLIESDEAQALLTTKLRKYSKQQQEVRNFMRYANSIIATEIKHDELKKESLLVSLDCMKSRNVELKKYLLLAKDRRQNMIENGNNKIKKLKQHLTTCKKRAESIPYLKKYIQLNNEIETTKKNNNTLIIEYKKICSNISTKKKELFNLDKKCLVQLADYMINKRPLILKLINERINALKLLQKPKQIEEPVRKYQFEIGELPASKFITVKIQPGDDAMEGTEDLSKNKNNDTVFPKLQLQKTDLLSPVQFNEIHKVSLTSSAPVKRSVDNARLEVHDIINKVMVVEKLNNVHVSTSLFKMPTLMESIDSFKNHTKKYSQKKLVHILDDANLDSARTFEIIPKLKPIQEVNVSEAEVSQQSLKEKVDEENIKVIEVIELTKKLSEDILIPPTQFLDSTQKIQERRVSFNTVIEIQDSSNLVTDDTRSQEDDVQLNASTASYDSCKKTINVFTKHNLNVSPEFTYTKNSVAPMEKGKNYMVTSKFFKDHIKKTDDNIDSTKQQVEVIDFVNDYDNPKNQVSVEPKQINKAIESDQFFEGQECTQNNTLSSRPTMKYIEHTLGVIPDSLNISTSTTGFEDADFPKCFDSSLLLSPKAEDIHTNSNKVEAQSHKVPHFLTGMRKTKFSLFGTTAFENKPESDVQNQNNNFNFNFGESRSKKIKRGGLFNMFR